MPGEEGGPAGPVGPDNSQPALDKRRLAEETRNERKVWYFLGYFLFGIHLVAFVMIYAVMHAPNK
jgi:nitrate reductase NapE component